MEQRLTFDTLWEQEERQGLLRRLRQEYPRWQWARRVRRTAVASVVVLLVAGFFFFNFQFSTPKSYDSVACNRSGIAEGHWAAEASRILTIETL